jgi:hypothetical protein
MAKRKGKQVEVTRVEQDGPSAVVITYTDEDGNEQRVHHDASADEVKVGDKITLEPETR